MNSDDESKTPEQKRKPCCGQKRQAVTRREFIGSTAAAAGAAAAAGLVVPELVRGQTALDPPTLRCVGVTDFSVFVEVTAGPSGAPAGFTIQWRALPAGIEDCSLAGPWTLLNTECSASFAGNPQCSSWNLGPGKSVVAEIGNFELACGASTLCLDELACGVFYAFRAFAHNVPQGPNRSPFTDTMCCRTEGCHDCTNNARYWRSNGPGDCAGKKGDLWPIHSLTIGGQIYDAAALCSAMHRRMFGLNGGGAVALLARQLIAAKLNMANGANGPSCSIAGADALLNGRNINTATEGLLTAAGQQMITAALCLIKYNRGTDGVDHCLDKPR